MVLLCVLCVRGGERAILLVENSQRKTKNQLKMASRAAMQWPSTRKHGLYQHNYPSISTVQTTMWMQEMGGRAGRHACVTTQVFLGTWAWGDLLQFMLEWAIVQLVRSQGGEWKVFFTSHTFHCDTLDEVVEFPVVKVIVDITTVAGATNRTVTREMLQ